MKFSFQILLPLWAIAMTIGHTKDKTILVREWVLSSGNVYRDRNGDGIVDWQVTGNARGTDGFGIYKEDNDFDGFYEREYLAGGMSYQIRDDKKIKEAVPPVHRLHKPTKIRRVKQVINKQEVKM